METKHISFIIPCYRSDRMIGQVVADVDRTCEGLGETSYEILLVNDASPDDNATRDAIWRLAAENAHVKGISLARNFGQHAALMAGLNASTGEIVICLDDDGQTPASEAPKLIAAIENGADAAYARYLNKQHSVARNFGTSLNEWMARVMIGKPKDLYVSSYFAVKRFVVDEMVRYTGAYPYVIGLVLRSTSNIVNVDVEHRARQTGASGYTFRKLFALWLNGFTAFSIKPLRVASLSGCILAAFGFLYGIWTIFKHFFTSLEQPLGWSALMSVILFIGGMILVMLGMVGEYIGRLYITNNNSPQYVIRETTRELPEQ